MESWDVLESAVWVVQEVVLVDLFLKRQWSNFELGALDSGQGIDSFSVDRNAVDVRLFAGMNVQHLLYLLRLGVHVGVHVVLQQ